MEISKLKINGDVAFQENGHKYFNLKNPSIEYISVTTLISRYEIPFESSWVSKYKALERLMPADVWKKEKELYGRTIKYQKIF